MAIGIVGRPELLFLDERTAGFDPEARRDFHDLVHQLSDLEDTTILLTTHDLAEAEKLADRILILSGGKIVADGSADQLAREVLGLLATMPIGIIVGALARSARSVGGLGFLLLGGLVAISGIFFPIDELWEPLRWLAQALPIYWIGLGMRSAVLPDAAAAAEIDGSWRTVETAGVLAAWSLAGLLAVPSVLRRMARRESGSLMEERRRALMQRLG